MIILIDTKRNKTIGQFQSIKEAIAYAKEEGIRVVSFEICKG